MLMVLTASPLFAVRRLPGLTSPVRDGVCFLLTLRGRLCPGREAQARVGRPGNAPEECGKAEP